MPSSCLLRVLIFGMSASVIIGCGPPGSSSSLRAGSRYSEQPLAPPSSGGGRSQNETLPPEQSPKMTGEYVSIIRGHREPPFLPVDGDPNGRLFPFVPAGIKTAEGADDLGNPETVERMLSSRVGMSYIWNRFYDINQLAYAFMNVRIMCDEAVCERPLGQLYPGFYNPTWREYLDAIALVSGTSWELKAIDGDEKEFAFAFKEPSMETNYAIELAAGWGSRFRGFEIDYYPPVAPIGMDIYDLGAYSSEDGEMLERAKEYWAQRIARGMDPSAKAADMNVTEVDGVSALQWTFTIPGSGATWRQWVFGKNGRCFAIVSVIHYSQEKEILPDVMKMVASFHAK